MGGGRPPDMESSVCICGVSGGLSFSGGRTNEGGLAAVRSGRGTHPISADFAVCFLNGGPHIQGDGGRSFVAKPEIGSQGLVRSMLQERQKEVHRGLRCGISSVPSRSSQTGLLRSEQAKTLVTNKEIVEQEGGHKDARLQRPTHPKR